jgi:hypothetical protein
MKCSRVGCDKEATHLNQIPLGFNLYGEEGFCEEHFNEEYQRKDSNVK